MTSVLTAFRDNAEKVAAAIAECRRLGIEVRMPDIHRSGLEFTVEGDAIRFGLLAVKNVGQGAIESIIAARDEGGEFRSLTDFCTRIDLRLANRKVLESLAKVGALARVRPPGPDPRRPRRCDRGGARRSSATALTGQTSLFDLGAAEARRPRGAAAEAPEDADPRAPALGEGAARALPLGAPDGRGRRRSSGEYVTAYSGDLARRVARRASGSSSPGSSPASGRS